MPVAWDQSHGCGAGNPTEPEDRQARDLFKKACVAGLRIACQAWAETEMNFAAGYFVPEEKKNAEKARALGQKIRGEYCPKGACGEVGW